jgi:hypothetical protein
VCSIVCVFRIQTDYCDFVSSGGFRIHTDYCDSNGGRPPHTILTPVKALCQDKALFHDYRACGLKCIAHHRKQAGFSLGFVAQEQQTSLVLII